jgi:cobaltochelatase CobN
MAAGQGGELTASCFPEAVLGPPCVLSLIVSNPGEAAQAKRRIAAVTIGHLRRCSSPPVCPVTQRARAFGRRIRTGGRSRPQAARAPGATIVDHAQCLASRAKPASVPTSARRGAASHRCLALDLKDLAVKDGLHVYGRAPASDAAELPAGSAAAESFALIAALDGRRVAPIRWRAMRGRRDVLPTGRNCSPPIRACRRRRPRWTPAGSLPTR